MAQYRFATLTLIAVGLLACNAPGSADGESIRTTSWAVHTVCGGENTVRGIDVSKWQGDINWSQVKGDNVHFGIARVSHGLGTIDEYFEANWKGMKDNGIRRGAYQYFNADEDATEQAKLFVDKINAAGGMNADDLPGVIDMEAGGVNGQSASTIVNGMKTWIAYVEEHLGKRAMIYTGSYFWDDNGLDDSLATHPLWIPNYTTNDCPLVADPWDKWVIWQYSDEGRINGISENVDLDRFNGTEAELDAFIAASNLQQPEPDAGPEPDAAAQDAPSTQDAAKEAGKDAGKDAVPATDSGSQAEAGEHDSSGQPSADAAGGHNGAPDDGDSGCSCRTTVPAGPMQWHWFAALAMGALTIRSRRRR